jgi:hypothetical protein
MKNAEGAAGCDLEDFAVTEVVIARVIIRTTE